MTNDKFSTAHRLAAAFGVSLPASVIEAREQLLTLERDARRTVTSTPAAAFAAQALDSADLEKGIAAAVKAQTAEATRAAMFGEVLVEARRRANEAVVAASEEIADSILASPALRRSFDSLTAAVSEAPPNLPFAPTIETHGPDAVVTAATIRKATAAFEDAVVAIEKLGVGWDFEGNFAGGGINPGERRHRASFLFAEVDYAPGTAFYETEKCRQGLAGLAALEYAWRTNATLVGGMSRDRMGDYRHAAVMLAQSPASSLSQATTVADYIDRYTAYLGAKERDYRERLEAEQRQRGGAYGASASAVVWGD